MNDTTDDDRAQSGKGVQIAKTDIAPLVGEATSKSTAVQTNVDPDHMEPDTTADNDLVDATIDVSDKPVSGSVSGEESVSGSAPAPTSDDDTADEVEEVIGNEPVPGKPFSLADEVEKDELDRRGIDPKDVGIEDTEE